MNASTGARPLTIAFVALGLSFLEATSARTWNPSLWELAADYTQIRHQVGDSAFVLVTWHVPESLAELGDWEFLRSQIVIALGHWEVSESGRFQARRVGEPRVKYSDGESVSALAESEVPGEVSRAISVLRGVQRQMGPMGTAVRFYVFESRDVHSCKPGVFWLVYAGEEYEFETPIPGFR